MIDPDGLRIHSRLAIPYEELHLRFSRSSGPGGQHAQRNETRVELLFDVAGSPSLTEEERHRIKARLARFIDKEGVLHLVVATHRSQAQNRAEALARLQMLLVGALRPRRKRIASQPDPAARARRLAEKRARAKTKELRRQIPEADTSE